MIRSNNIFHVEHMVKKGYKIKKKDLYRQCTKLCEDIRYYMNCKKLDEEFGLDTIEENVVDYFRKRI